MGSLGAAMYAGVGSGVFDNLADAVAHCVDVVESYSPDPERHALYTKSFNRWNKAYDALNSGYYTDELMDKL